jgi:hypothetical protein
MTVGVRSRRVAVLVGTGWQPTRVVPSALVGRPQGAWRSAKARSQHRRLLPLDPRPPSRLARPSPHPDARPGRCHAVTNRCHLAGQTTVIEATRTHRIHTQLETTGAKKLPERSPGLVPVRPAPRKSSSARHHGLGEEALVQPGCSAIGTPCAIRKRAVPSTRSRVSGKKSR